MFPLSLLISLHKDSYFLIEFCHHDMALCKELIVSYGRKNQIN
jgi:hypothetical protein